MSVHPKAKLIIPKIKYELDMFKYCYHKIMSEEADSSRKKHHNIILEGFLLHARILRDFFIGDPKKDDVLAIHFFDDQTVWKNIKETLCPYLRKHNELLNKYLAHLTYSRLKEDKDRKRHK